jgi:hypothetical protein
MTCSISFLNIDDEREMIQWAINNCDSFIYKTIKDIRREDCYDSLHEFFFIEEKDAMWFRLHWQ